MSTFNALTAASLAALSAGCPIFYRGADGNMSVEHILLDPANRTIARSVTLGVSDAKDWKFDPQTVQVGSTVTSKTGSAYIVSARVGEGETLRVVAYFKGKLSDEKIPLFSTEPK